MSETVTPLHWKNKAMSAIGRIMVTYSAFEEHLELVIGQLMGFDIYSETDRNTIWATTAQLQAKPKIELFQKLVDIRISDPKERDELIELAKEADRLNNDRNDLVHARWVGFAGDEKFFTRRFKNREKLIYKQRDFTVEEMNNIHIRIMKLISDLNQYAARHILKDATSP